MAGAAFAGSSKTTPLCRQVTNAMNLYWLIKRFLSTYCVPSTVPGIQRRQRHVPAVKLFTVK